ncbi:MAG: methylenetetrahydrofolate--tRNA-(uracil(54)-C(5))-methyltransferase (FADH(2)-oxidizing) TrmFO [Armatimonadetes bacterium]|nr:methylenetetrahydrofolate--tRNA-(uracil(54)-C(5))-methyltransferase (FADH(2)-oxidizing) TrmFO [Armatimonadota bacterium]MDE2206044.1 methylenetetrahydrofolate--tRNA-(uracil(54)-C(5))-methyltransferase (FADH(2)-oxidizing) TrmFO [Armatimonadota bacterium]
MQRPQVSIIGGGFAGVEGAWAAAQRGCRVTLYEMRPERFTAAHRTSELAELVCSNSFKSELMTNASGVLKEEMRRLGSLILPLADCHRVAAGEALAVDREPFSRAVTANIESHPHISVVRREITELPPERPLVVATGPLTSPPLAQALRAVTGEDALAFYDAVAPTLLAESLDMSRIFRASRSPRNGQPVADEGDYLNCPLNREEFVEFWTALKDAETAPLHDFEAEAGSTPFFEMCVPVEELARRGPRTLCFGPMKPIGLSDPTTGRRPWAVCQLRQENREGTLWGMVGFQTRLRWGEQKRVFRMIPGLESAEFIRYGVMHRNTYVNAPRVLGTGGEVIGQAGLFLAGQITGVEGYLESAAIGLLAGINAARRVRGFPACIPPRETVLGSLCHYLSASDPRHFAPMNSNWGIVSELDGTPIRDKRERARQKGERALAALDAWSAADGVLPEESTPA